MSRGSFLKGLMGLPDSRWWQAISGENMALQMILHELMASYRVVL